MLREDYVSFETAKLLKKKGFNGECDLFGRTDEPELIIREAAKIAYNQGIDDECVIIPTHQMAIKWLREKHKITISILFEGDRIYYEIHQNNKFVFGVDTPESYEEVCEEAIKRCLKNLI